MVRRLQLALTVVYQNETLIWQIAIIAMQVIIQINMLCAVKAFKDP